MSNERAPWKVTVVLLAAAVGMWLGVLGSHAPRLSSSLSHMVPPPEGGSGSPPRARSSHPAAVRNPDGTRHPRAAARTAPAAPGAPQAAGPLLADMWYASRAHELYPTMTLASDDRILTGFQISVRPADGANEVVTVTSVQDNATQSATFPRADRLYFVETRLGDDGVDGETNGGDDGFILTDAQGHILGR